VALYPEFANFGDGVSRGMPESSLSLATCRWPVV